MELGIWIVVVVILWVSLDIPLVWCLGIAALAYIMLKGGGIGNAFTGIKNAVGGMVKFLTRLAIFVPIFMGITMIVTVASGISPHNATRRLQVLGPMPWNWHSNIDLPLVLFTCLMFLVTAASVKVAWGDYKLGGWIFGGSAVILILILFLPMTLSKIVPTKTNANGITTPSAAGIDEAVAKSIPVVPIDPVEVKQHGAIGSSARRLWTWAFGEGESKQTHDYTLVAPPATHVNVGKQKRLYNFSGDGCVTVNLHGDYDIYPKGGEIVITPPPPAKPWHDKPGTALVKGMTPPGTYTVCRVDPSAWGVEIWN